LRIIAKNTQQFFIEKVNFYQQKFIEFLFIYKSLVPVNNYFTEFGIIELSFELFSNY